MAAPIPLFPPSPSVSFVVDPALQGAVTGAIVELTGARKKVIPFAFAIIDLGDGSGRGTLKCGTYKSDEVHYNASAAKVAALYASYALRDMAKRFHAAKLATKVGAALVGGAASMASSMTAGRVRFPAATAVAAAAAKDTPLFTALRAHIDPAIDSGAPTLLKSVGREHRVPHYENVFDAAKGGVAPEFRSDYRASMRDMIVPSDNNAAGRCIRGVGYGYLNGALASAGLFDKKKESIVWLAGDYVGKWPYARIDSNNDKGVAQAGSALGMAQMMAMIVTRAVIDPASCNEMRGWLEDAVGGPDQPFLTRVEAMDPKFLIPINKVTHCKLGFGPLKRGGVVLSEIFRLEGLRKPNKSYVIAYQNVNETETSLDDVSFMIRRTLELYE